MTDILGELSSTFDEFLAVRSNSTAIMASICMRLHVANTRPLCDRFLRFNYCPFFFTKKIINNVAFRHILRCLCCSFRIDVATALRQIRLIAGWRNGRCRAECGNVEGSEERCKRPGGRGGARSKKYVSKMTHGFFKTINSMILYFKHIIHIDDFPLNWPPPSSSYRHTSNSCVVGFTIIIALNELIYSPPS